jgi:hypothetical protein
MVNQVRDDPHDDLAAAPISRVMAGRHLGLDLDVINPGFTAGRLPPLAPQKPQIGNAALVEWKAVTLLLDHALRFPACRCTRGCNRGATPMPTR